VSFNLIAILFYPGSTYLNHETTKYSFTNNFLSDLGRTVTHKGIPNFYSAFFFNITMFLCGLIFSFFYAILPIYFTENSVLFKGAILSSILGVLSSLSFSLVGLTPADLYLKEHIFFADKIFHLAFPSSLIYSIIIINSKKILSKYGFGYLIFAMSILVYILVLELGPSPQSDFGLLFQATSQKIIAICFVIATWLFAKGIKYSLNNS
jgi:hypothetical membrane protein